MGGGLGGSRGSGLGKLPYSRMEMPSSSGGGIGMLRRATSPLRARCYMKVKDASRCRMLTELCAFSAALVFVDCHDTRMMAILLCHETP
ncbi:unnamed protein product, partial [Ectocarpus sp. 4 AP-2014]